MNIFHFMLASKQEKKKALAKKNKKHRMLFDFLRMRRAEEARIRSMEELRKKTRPSEKKPGEWSDKTSQIRNRLTGKKRDSKERWNRFAGTSDAGGRGL